MILGKFRPHFFSTFKFPLWSNAPATHSSRQTAVPSHGGGARSTGRSCAPRLQCSTLSNVLRFGADKCSTAIIGRLKVSIGLRNLRWIGSNSRNLQGRSCVVCSTNYRVPQFPPCRQFNRRTSSVAYRGE